jgi:hypothetical protein
VTLGVGPWITGGPRAALLREALTAGDLRQRGGNECRRLRPCSPATIGGIMLSGLFSALLLVRKRGARRPALRTRGHGEQVRVGKSPRKSVPRRLGALRGDKPVHDLAARAHATRWSGQSPARWSPDARPVGPPWAGNGSAVKRNRPA